MAAILPFIWSKLLAFQTCFPLTTTFYTFCIIVMGFLSRDDHWGVTSFCRHGLDVHPDRYESLLRFFRSSAVCLNKIRNIWYQTAKEDGDLYTIQDHCCLIGDGTARKHYGRRMPAVTKLAKYGDKSVQCSYFHGHFWGCTSVVKKSHGTPISIPLKITIQGGLQGIRNWFTPDLSNVPLDDQEVQKKINSLMEGRMDSHVVQIIRDAFECSLRFGSCIVMLDRYFLSVNLLKTLQELNKPFITPQLHVITRARMNITAYHKPVPKTKKGPGAPRKKGDAVHLKDLFDQKADEFKSGKALMYGEKEQDVKYYCIDLLWGKTLYQLLRFVLVVLDDGTRTILVSTDLNLTPEEIIHGYSVRFKIELMFRDYKQVFAGLMSRFWTKSMPKLNLFQKKGEPSPFEAVTDLKDRLAILTTLKAYECYAAMAAIAMGIAQMLVARPRFATILRNYQWKRTQRGTLVSVATATYYFRYRINALMSKAASCPLTSIIREWQSPPKGQEKAA